MQIAKSIDDVRAGIREARSLGKRVGFVPTMGYLHQGHLSLVEISKQKTDYQVMSIFVNRIQFNDPDDFDAYPVDLQKDFDLAQTTGVDMMFVPDETVMYRDHLTYVNVEMLTGHLCGACRPGHFTGVFTVVSKLFNIVQPDVAVFGQKDIQQVVSIQKMVSDLNFPVEVVIAPIIREDDGLAMSSRNKHLDPVQRKDALALSRALRKVEELINAGERSSAAIIVAINGVLEKGGADRVDYISLVDYGTLGPVDMLEEKAVLAIAVFYGTTRLIDNMIIEKKVGGYECTY